MPLGCRRNRRFAYLLVLVLALTLLAGVADARADISFRADYESGTCCDSNGWHDVQYEFDRPMTDSFSIVTNPVRQGHYAAKVVAQQGYSPFGWGESTEAASNMTGQGEGADYYYAWSTMFDPSWVSPYGWGDIVQFYTDNWVKFGGPPPVSLDTSGTSIVVSVLAGRYDEPGTSADAWRGWYTHPGTSTPSLIGYSFNQNYQILNTLSLGQWNDFVMHVHWSAHDGQIQMWHRLPGQSWIEVLSVNVPTLRYDPQTGLSDDIGLLKQGLYRESYCQQPTVLTACNSTLGLQPPDILYEDAFVRGSSFDEVVAAAFDNSGQSAASAPPPPAAGSTPAVSQSNTPAAPTGADLPLVGNLSPATDSGCSGCVVSTSRGPGDVDATIAGGLDSLDTAYGLADFGGSSGWSGRVWTRDVIALAPSTPLGGNLSVLQQRDASGNLVWEIYVDGSNRQISLWSPAGGLGSSAINRSTGVVMDGQSHSVEISALPNDSVVVRVDGQDRITLTGLSGSTSGNLRFLRIGIDHYDTGTSNEPISISHSDVGVSTLGWLGSRTSALSGASAGSSASSGAEGATSKSSGGGGSAAADLSLALSATPPIPTDTVTYTAVVSDANGGPGSNLVLTMNLPSSATAVSMSADRGSGCTGTTKITCNLDWISGSLAAHVTITAHVPAGVQLTATASVSETEPDPNLKNNSASVTVGAKVAFGVPAPKPSGGKSAPRSGATGQTVPSARQPVIFVERPRVAGRRTVIVRLATRPPRIRLEIIVSDARGRKLGSTYAVSTRQGRSLQLVTLRRWQGQATLNVIVRSHIAGHAHPTNTQFRMSRREVAACWGTH